MLLAVGTRVRIRHSKDEGVVTARLEHNMVNVLLDGMDMDIPIAVDDLVPIAESDSSVKAAPNKQEKTTNSPGSPDGKNRNTPLEHQGIQLAFAPAGGEGASSEQYTIYLLNDTAHDLLFSFRLQLRDAVDRRQKGRLPAQSVREVGRLLFDQLNDAPAVEVEGWRITPQGTGNRLYRKIRIRPSRFFKQLKIAPLLHRKVHLFKIFEEVTKSTGKQPPKEDLRTYTQRNARPADKWRPKQRFPHDIMAFAEFVPEIDLHIEKLQKDYSKMSKADILHLQLQHFEEYINQAIVLGVERVFIIHGIGKGRLREAIADRLKEIPEVTRFKNEYHPKYGWGATEVIFT